jgi:cell wall-associated NlpC family hydrolase
VAIASELVGAPSIKYKGPEHGQSPEEGFDCSGFARFVLQSAGLVIPPFVSGGVERPVRHANEFWDSYGIPVHGQLRQPGDLIVFSRDGVRPTHIGIVRDFDTYIHAPGKEGTQVEIQDIRYRDIARDALLNQLYVRSPIGFKRPTTVLPGPARRRHHRPIE